MENHVHKGRERNDVLGPKEVGSVTARVWSQEGWKINQIDAKEVRSRPRIWD